VLAVSTDKCSRTTVSSHELSNVLYIANPNDCLIDADALKGPLEIPLPSFFDYEQSRIITIKKIDSSNHSVNIKTENFTVSLKTLNESLNVQWTQPLYMNGRWQIVNGIPVAPSMN
jgi:hypothetical protein